MIKKTTLNCKFGCKKAFLNLELSDDLLDAATTVALKEWGLDEIGNFVETKTNSKKRDQAEKLLNELQTKYLNIDTSKLKEKINTVKAAISGNEARIKELKPQKTNLSNEIVKMTKSKYLLDIELNKASSDLKAAEKAFEDYKQTKIAKLGNKTAQFIKENESLFRGAQQYNDDDIREVKRLLKVKENEVARLKEGLAKKKKEKENSGDIKVTQTKLDDILSQLGKLEPELSRLNAAKTEHQDILDRLNSIDPKSNVDATEQADYSNITKDNILNYNSIEDFQTILTKEKVASEPPMDIDALRTYDTKMKNRNEIHKKLRSHLQKLIELLGDKKAEDVENENTVRVHLEFISFHCAQESLAVILNRVNPKWSFTSYDTTINFVASKNYENYTGKTKQVKNNLKYENLRY